MFNRLLFPWKRKDRANGKENILRVQRDDLWIGWSQLNKFSYKAVYYLEEKVVPAAHLYSPYLLHINPPESNLTIPLTDNHT